MEATAHDFLLQHFPNMAKRKSRAEIRVPDGTGGMVQLHDHRFENDWPAELQVSTENADSWMRYLSATLEQRGWTMGALSQHDRKENSGTITIARDATTVLTLIWERKRGGPMTIRARSEAPAELPLSEVNALLDQVTTRCTAQETQEFFRWGCLEYEGLPWRGELWLDDNLRLGPPSRQYEKALLGPRAVLVSVRVRAVSAMDALHGFEKNLRELSGFLSVVMRTKVERTDQRQTWAWEIGTDGKTISGAEFGIYRAEWANPDRTTRDLQPCPSLPGDPT